MLKGFEVEPFVAAAIALLGVVVGLVIGRFALPGRRKIKRLETEIEQLRREHADYRVRVSTHFHKTGELIGQMTASYKAVYDHLSDGAQTLCAGDALAGPAFPVPRLILADNIEVAAGGVTAARLGAAGTSGSSGEASADLSVAGGGEEKNSGSVAGDGADEGVARRPATATTSVGGDEAAQLDRAC